MRSSASGRRYLGCFRLHSLWEWRALSYFSPMGNDLKKISTTILDLLGGGDHIIKCMFEYSPTEPQEWFHEQTMSRHCRGSRSPGRHPHCQLLVPSFPGMTVFQLRLVATEPRYWDAAVLSFRVWPALRRPGRDRRSGSASSAVIWPGGFRAASRRPWQDPDHLRQPLYGVGVLGGVRSADRSMSVYIPLPTAQARVEHLTPARYRLCPLPHLG
jgi:hypothetical protein